MSIEKRLKQDAVRFSTMQPPADLRARLQASLDAVPPMDMSSAQVRRPVRKWFAPVVSILTICMMLVFMSALPIGLGTLSQEQPGVLMQQGEATPDDTGEVLKAASDKSSGDLTSGSALPIDRIGLFSGLALVTGFLCITELKGRPRLMVPALVALTLFLAVALMYMLGII